eukprot:TRINITY_DN5179_c0_g1_i1.p1 TRINITY_DN5179_c0_g1~~TRINITY_DN5179_c0_g1_i1.p1  ORF type:complete len:1224 (+),score=149.74 TRINITY_DN5179_c0_g1_i1:61-3732(+)
MAALWLPPLNSPERTLNTSGEAAKPLWASPAPPNEWQVLHGFGSTYPPVPLRPIPQLAVPYTPAATLPEPKKQSIPTVHRNSRPKVPSIAPEAAPLVKPANPNQEGKPPWVVPAVNGVVPKAPYTHWTNPADDPPKRRPVPVMYAAPLPKPPPVEEPSPPARKKKPKRNSEKQAPIAVADLLGDSPLSSGPSTPRIPQPPPPQAQPANVPGPRRSGRQERRSQPPDPEPVKIVAVPIPSGLAPQPPRHVVPVAPPIIWRPPAEPTVPPTPPTLPTSNLPKTMVWTPSAPKPQKDSALAPDYVHRDILRYQPPSTTPPISPTPPKSASVLLPAARPAPARPPTGTGLELLHSALPVAPPYVDLLYQARPEPIVLGVDLLVAATTAAGLLPTSRGIRLLKGIEPLAPPHPQSTLPLFELGQLLGSEEGNRLVIEEVEISRRQGFLQREEELFRNRLREARDSAFNTITKRMQEIHQKMQDDGKQLAAKKIQSNFRGHLGRIELAKRLQEKELRDSELRAQNEEEVRQERAAIKIQSTYRGSVDRARTAATKGSPAQLVVEVVRATGISEEPNATYAVGLLVNTSRKQTTAQRPPVWNEGFKFGVQVFPRPPGTVCKQTCRIEVADMANKRRLGQGVLVLDTLQNGVQHDVVVNLSRRGQVHLRLTAVDFGAVNTKRSPQQEAWASSELAHRESVERDEAVSRSKLLFRQEIDQRDILRRAEAIAAAALQEQRKNLHDAEENERRFISHVKALSEAERTLRDMYNTQQWAERQEIEHTFVLRKLRLPTLALNSVRDGETTARALCVLQEQATREELARAFKDVPKRAGVAQTDIATSGAQGTQTITSPCRPVPTQTADVSRSVLSTQTEPSLSQSGTQTEHPDRLYDNSFSQLVSDETARRRSIIAEQSTGRLKLEERAVRSLLENAQVYAQQAIFLHEEEEWTRMNVRIIERAWIRYRFRSIPVRDRVIAQVTLEQQLNSVAVPVMPAFAYDPYNQVAPIPVPENDVYAPEPFFEDPLAIHYYGLYPSEYYPEPGTRRPRSQDRSRDRAQRRRHRDRKQKTRVTQTTHDQAVQANRPESPPTTHVDENTAAIRIQSTYRGHVGRRHVAERRASQGLRPTVGIEIKMLDDGFGGTDNVVVVHAVVPGGPAHKAGIEADDVVMSWNGQPLNSKAAFAAVVTGSAIGSTIILGISRKGKVLQMPLTIEGTAKSKTAARVVKSNSIAPR